MERYIYLSYCFFVFMDVDLQGLETYLIKMIKFLGLICNLLRTLIVEKILKEGKISIKA